MKGKITIIIALITVLTIIVFFVKEKSQPNKLQKVTVQAGWVLNGEFANVCSAIVNGYYADEGLDVELIPGGPSGASFIVATNAVAQNSNITLGIDGDLVPLTRGKAKENQNDRIKVKAFAAFWNKNPYGFIVRADSGINNFKDFIKTKPDGTKYKIGITADSVIQYAIAKYNNIPVEDLELVTVGFDDTPFLTGQVDALGAYWTTQVYGIEKANIKYKFISSSELPGFDQPSMIAMASENMLKNNPELLEKWLKATIKGSKFILSNPEKAGEQITNPKCGGKQFNAEQETWLIKKSLPLFDKNKIGWIYEDQITNFVKGYYNLKQIERIPSVNELIDYSILRKIYH